MPVGSTIGGLDWSEQVRRLARAALDLLFPPRCVVCRRPGASLCLDCIQSFEQIQGPVCPSCGEPQAWPVLCYRCLNGRRFESVQSAFLFTGAVRQAIHALKYEHRREMGRPLAHSMADALPAPALGAALCPVPLHPTRLAQRGYNQSRLIAEQLSIIWSGCSVLPDRALSRTRDTVSQVDLDYAGRQMNVSQAFCADPTSVAQRSIILIDDVCTTGATLDACAAALWDAGAASVRAITVARAV